MTIACLIPARYQSSRFPGKLLAKALGKTVLQRTVESAFRLFSREQVFVATDDERIAEHAAFVGATVVWTSSQHVNGTERIAEAVGKIDVLRSAEIIVNLQGDHPCTQPQTFQSAIDALRSDPKASMSTVATPIDNESDFFSPHVVKVVLDRHSNALYFSRSPIPYIKNFTSQSRALQHIGLYCFRRSFLLDYVNMGKSALQEEDLEQLKVLEQGYSIKVAIVQEKSIGVDAPEDLNRLIAHLESL